MREQIAINGLHANNPASAVERFARLHERQELDYSWRKYHDLIPAQAPAKGEQYAFEVDLDRCTGCKACVAACHNENGLDEDETWRSVGLLQTTGDGAARIQHITHACHHCLEPACMHGCPTRAYEKDPATGIVRHLEDQCFGCQYCILECPYEVPQYSKKRGIVHKCDMCIGRLKAGEAPACVRGCPTQAIRIVFEDVQKIKDNFAAYVRIPQAPASHYTYPTTRYTTKRPLPASMVSVDYEAVHPQRSHLPLVGMLVLTQLSVGAFFAEWFRQSVPAQDSAGWFFPFHALAALGAGALALAASVFHLGRPQYAFRAVLGLKRSWLSREIVAFILFSHLAVLYALCLWLNPMEDFLSRFLGREAVQLLAAIVSLSGLGGVFCSAMVYRDTKRPFWDTHFTTLKFFMTAAILGSATFLLVPGPFGRYYCLVVLALTFLKLTLEAMVFFSLYQSETSFLKKTAILMTGPLKSCSLWRFGCGILGGFLLPLAYLSVLGAGPATALFIFPVLILVFSLAGELLERYLFFRTAVPLKMPGGKLS